MTEFFKLITPITYWILILLWSFILYFYVKKMWDSKTKQLFQALVIILAIDAFRTLFESLYFGLWYTSLSGLIPSQIGDFLTQPELVIIPKILNVAAAVIIIVLLLKRWLPKEELEQNRLGMALHNSEEEFRALFENNPVSCWLEDFTEVQSCFGDLRGQGVLDLDAYFDEYPEKLTALSRAIKVMDVNQATVDLHKAENKEQLYQGLEQTFTAESFEVFRKEIIDLWDGKTQNSYDGIVKTFDGDLRYVQISYRVLPGYENTLEKVLISLVDNTKRKQAERTLLESETKYKTLFDSVSDAIFIYDPVSMEILEANEATSKIYGYDRNELIGSSCLKLSAEVKQSTSAASQIANTGHVNVPLRHHKNKNGSDLYVDLAGYKAVVNGHDFMFAICKDVTVKLETERQLRQSQKHESIGTLAGGIAHDFNNILSSVLGFTELALDAVDKESSISGDLQEVYAAGLRAKDLVNQILTFARQSEEKLKPIQVDYIIKEVLKFIRSTIPTTIDIKQHLDSDSMIMGNTTQVHQIIMNLCTNAAHAMEEDGGVLEVTLKDITLDRASGIDKLKYGNYIEIKVSDTGTGIDPHIAERIFEPYFTTKNPGEGTGLGLALVHGIVESYGGKITVTNKLDKGAVFTIYFPICKSNKVNPVDNPEELPKGQERILYVDDELSIVKFGSRILGQLGYSVTPVTSSLEALELFKTKPDDFDLVISDVTMPKMTGDKLVIKLMQIRPDIPVILATGYSKKLSEEKALEIGVKAFVVKPVIKVDLAKIVRKVLDDVKRSNLEKP